jgi:hypothetical protein
MDSSDRLNKTLGLLAGLGVGSLALSLAAYRERMEDLPWHLKAGEWIVAHRAIPTADFFSFSRQGMEWLDAQWLFQLIVYGAYRLLGEAGPTALNMALIAAVLILLLRALPERIPPGLAGLAGVLFLLGMNPRIICRPELLSALYMAGLCFCLERARRGRPAWLIWVPLIQVLWVNSEGLWPIGWAIIGAYTADLAWDRRRGPAFSWRKPVPASWAIALAASGLAGLIQPYGLRGFLFPLTLLREVTLPSVAHKQWIFEFQPLFSPPWLPASALPFLVFMTAAVVVTLAGGKSLRPFLSLLGLGFIFLALDARRNLGIASVGLMMVLLAHLEILVRKYPALFLGPRLSRAASILTLSSALGFAVLAQAQPIRTWDRSGREPGFGLSRKSYPAEAADFLQSIGYQGKIINNTGAGGYLIWRGWPQWQVFADSRMEVGGEAALTQGAQLFTDPGVFREIANRDQVEAVVVLHQLPYLRQFSLRLLQNPEWALVHLDWAYAVFLRRAPRWQAVIAQNEIPLETVIARLQKQRTGSPAPPPGP